MHVVKDSIGNQLQGRLVEDTQGVVRGNGGEIPVDRQDCVDVRVCRQGRGGVTEECCGPHRK